MADNGDKKHPTNSGGNGRDLSTGRFLPGHKFSSGGNAFGARVHKLKSHLMKRVGKPEFDQIIDALLKKAYAGDTVAIRIAFEYLMGKPPQSVDVAVSSPLSQLSPEELRAAELRLGLQIKTYSLDHDNREE